MGNQPSTWNTQEVLLYSCSFIDQCSISIPRWEAKAQCNLFSETPCYLHIVLSRKHYLVLTKAQIPFWFPSHEDFLGLGLPYGTQVAIHFSSGQVVTLTGRSWDAPPVLSTDPQPDFGKPSQYCIIFLQYLRRLQRTPK